MTDDDKRKPKSLAELTAPGRSSRSRTETRPLCPEYVREDRGHRSSMLWEERMCGSCSPSSKFSLEHRLKEEARSQRSWHKCAKRHGPPRGRRGHWFQRRGQPRLRPPTASLRPANVQGNRAPGMRAPRNTNQFLMHEKYQLMHLRSDSVGTDSGSDCELDPADMDAYLGVLENSRGALLDTHDLPSPTARRALALFGLEQEDSRQYFPSEHDVLQSEDFMKKDFNAFCDSVAPCI